MSITYNIVQRGEPGVPGGGEHKYYASANASGEIDIEEMSELIEMISTVSDIDVSGVLKSFVKLAPRELAKGKIVRLGELGSLRVSLSSSGHETEDEVSDKSITGTRIIFTPGPKLKEMLASLTFEKIKPENGV